MFHIIITDWNYKTLPGLGDNLISILLAVEEWGPEFDLEKWGKKARSGSVHLVLGYWSATVTDSCSYAHADTYMTTTL